ncbi:MAG TPA: hypothetical protein VGF94_22140 [Kofleriaceae bacterium]|jgi:hypothetical protein
MKKRWHPGVVAVLGSVLCGVAWVGLGFARGAITGEYEAAGRAVGHYLVPVLAVGAIVGYLAQDRRTRGVD